VLVLQALLLFAYWRWRQGTLRHLGSKALEQRLLQGFSARRFWVKNGLFALGLILIVVALANPQQLQRKEPPPQESADVIIALDLSRSMLATDIAPSRLEQAKKLIRNLVEALQGERIGLVFFAGSAYPQAPLSNDHEALMLFVSNGTPGFIADQGSDLGAAIEVAGRLFDPASPAGKALILISDGEDHGGKGVRQAEQARADGFVVHTVCAGTTGSFNIPLEKGAFQRDAAGKMVQTSASPEAMRDIARAGNGLYLNLDKGASANVRALKAEIDQLRKARVQQLATTEYLTYYQWFLFPALLLLVLEQMLWWRKKENKQEGQQ
jgi:Ca-activated chloride channel family protein